MEYVLKALYFAFNGIFDIRVPDNNSFDGCLLELAFEQFLYLVILFCCFVYRFGMAIFEYRSKRLNFLT